MSGEGSKREPVAHRVSEQGKWIALEVTFDSAAREAVLYGLMEAGAQGTEESDIDENELITATAYFDRLPDETSVRSIVEDALRLYDLSADAVQSMKSFEVPIRDWLGEWKKTWQPVTVGRRLVIAPPWSEVAEAPDRVVVRIEPGMAFGTGTHETTRLCLEAIERHFNGGSLLDVGTGTGILAISAAKLFPNSRVDACDTDAEAIEIARENARLNGVEDRIRFRIGSIEEQDTSSADLVCANLTTNVIVTLLPSLVAATCGRLVLSGILEEQVGQIEDGLKALGIERFKIRTLGDWVAVIV